MTTTPPDTRPDTIQTPGQTPPQTLSGPPGQTPQPDTGSSLARKLLIVVGVIGALAVNVAAFMLSADAITAVAKAAGVSAAIAWAMVLAVDGLMTTGTMVFIANKIRGRSVAYPLVVLGAGVTLSIICNALHAKASGGHLALDDRTREAVSSIPAVALFLSFHLIADMIKGNLEDGKATAETGQTSSGEHLPERPDTIARTPQTVSGGPRPDSVWMPNQTPQTVSVERRPDSVQTPVQTPAQTVSGPPGQTPRTAVTRQTPDTVQTPPAVPAQTPAVRPAKPVQTPRKALTESAEPIAKLVPIDRDKVRELLSADRDMTAGKLATALGRTNTGTLRTIRTEILAELDAADQTPEAHAVSE